MNDSQLTPALPTVGLYIHFPWCVRRCPYCDFNAHRLKREQDISRYVDALLADIETEASYAARGRIISSVFLGGGTPSLLPPEQLGRILDAMRQNFILAEDCEVTMEANPGTAEAENFRAYCDLGINRLSIGVQSFSDAQLKTLGRIHDQGQAEAAIQMALDIPFAQVNLDIMFALPSQTLGMAMDDLGRAIAYETGHVSWYQLTMEPNTPFAHLPPAGLPDNDLAADMQAAGAELLTATGYERYEVSAYQKTGMCRHNWNYWQFGDYIGVGAGAHGKLSWLDEADGLRVERRQKYKTPARFMLNQPCHLQEQRWLGENDLLLEYFLNRLRLLQEPMSAAEATVKTGLDSTQVETVLKRWQAEGYLEIVNTAKPTWLLSDLGRNHIDSLLVELT